MRLNALVMTALTCMLFQVGIAATLQRSGIRSQLSERDIADAIEFGTVGRPEPYVIRHAAPKDVPNTLSRIVAAVYTPYIRVALVARASANSGARLLQSAVGYDLTQPIAYVVYRWTCCDDGVSDVTRQAPIRVAAPGVERFSDRSTAPAVVGTV
jgi:hypothetical protein